LLPRWPGGAGRVCRQRPGEGFVNGNGRIEATEIDVATKLPGRIEDILVREGDFVTAGQPLAKMRLETLEAQRDEAWPCVSRRAFGDRGAGTGGAA
jgi:acetyl/propionyl-CoA carboxylase alpha subunit